LRAQITSLELSDSSGPRSHPRSHHEDSLYVLNSPDTDLTLPPSLLRDWTERRLPSSPLNHMPNRIPTLNTTATKRKRHPTDIDGELDDQFPIRLDARGRVLGPMVLGTRQRGL
jgi:hypothetical protein